MIKNCDKCYSTPPSIAILELTLECNMDCIHCGSSAGKARKNELSTEEIKTVINELAEIGTGGIALMGGEVFLRKDWYEISEEIKKLGMKLSIATNGYFNPENIVPKLLKLEIDSLSVGLDGTKKTHNYIRGRNDAFDKTMKFIEMTQKEGLDPCPLTTFFKTNFNEFAEIKKLVLEKGLEWDVNMGSLIGRFPKELMLSCEQYYEIGLLTAAVKKEYPNNNIYTGHNIGFHSQIIPSFSVSQTWNGCYAGKTNIGIKSNGDVNGCLPLPDKFTEENIRNKGIKNIWNDPNAFSYNRQFNLDTDLHGFCKKCKYKFTCKGGCTMNASTITGKNHGDPYCFYRIEKEIFGREIDKKVQELIEKNSISI